MTKTEQVLANGKITIDFDEKLSMTQIDQCICSLLPGAFFREGKQIIGFDRVGILACNITYLGNPHPIHKKRIQLKQYYPDIVAKNTLSGLKTLFVGVYTYRNVQLFVSFEPCTYLEGKFNNSAAHVYSSNLQYAQINGEFTKIDAFGNVIHIFTKNNFLKYLKSVAGCLNEKYDFDSIQKLIKEYLEEFFKRIPQSWYGIDCYKEMVRNNFKNARQNRWPGWYFEYIFQMYLKTNATTKVVWNADKTDKGIDLDIKFPFMEWTYGDAKADQIDEDILGNDFSVFDEVVDKHNGSVYYICALYKAEKDSDHDYAVTKYWNSLRDIDKQYINEWEMKNGAGKAMKYSVKLQSINVLKIDKTMYGILKENPFNQGVNSDGKPRNPKLKIKKNLIKELSIYEYRY